MSMALDLRCLMVSLAIPHAVELSTCMGVGGCGCPISSRVLRRATASFIFVNTPAISASAVDDVTTLMTPVGLRMGPLSILSVVLPM